VMKRIEVPTWIWVQLCAPGYTPVILSVLGRVTFSAQLTPIVASYFNPLVIASFALISVGAGWALWVSNSEHAFRIHPGLSGFRIFLHSCVSGFLLVLIP